MSTKTPYTPDLIEAVIPQLQRKWYAQRQIVAFKPLDSARATIVAWGQAAAETLHAWDPIRPYLALHDLSHPGVALQYSTTYKNILRPAITDEGMQMVADLLGAESLLRIHIAILVSVQFSGHLAGTFAQLEARRQTQKHIDFELFTDETIALRWLASHLT